MTTTKAQTARFISRNEKLTVPATPEEKELYRHYGQLCGGSGANLTTWVIRRREARGEVV